MIERIIIIVEGGNIQNIMTDNPNSKVEVIVVDYDNLRGGQLYPPGPWYMELNPEQVELCATGEHPDIKHYLEDNRKAEKEQK